MLDKERRRGGNGGKGVVLILLKLEVGSWKLEVEGGEEEAFMEEGFEEYKCAAVYRFESAEVQTSC